jgi:hypothetical protein
VADQGSVPAVHLIIAVGEKHAARKLRHGGARVDCLPHPT